MLEEGIINNMITKRMYAKTDRAERNIRVAEKNHSECTLKNTTSDSDNKK